MTNADLSLELSAQEMERLVQRAMAYITQHIESLPDQPSTYSGGGAQLARSLAEPMPEQGTPFEALLQLIFERLTPATYNTVGPGYLGYIPGGVIGLQKPARVPIWVSA